MKILARPANRTPRPIAIVAKDFQEFLVSKNSGVEVEVVGNELFVSGFSKDSDKQTAIYEGYPVIYQK